MQEIPTTEDVDIRIIRDWIRKRGGFFHDTCTLTMITGYDDKGVYLKCLECSEVARIGLSTYQKILKEIGYEQ